MFPTWSDWDLKYTKKGYAKLVGKRFIKLLALIATVSVALRLRQKGQGMEDAKVFLLRNIREVISTGTNVLQSAGKKL